MTENEPPRASSRETAPTSQRDAILEQARAQFGDVLRDDMTTDAGAGWSQWEHGYFDALRDLWTNAGEPVWAASRAPAETSAPPTNDHTQGT